MVSQLYSSFISWFVSFSGRVSTSTMQRSLPSGLDHIGGPGRVYSSPSVGSTKTESLIGARMGAYKARTASSKVMGAAGALEGKGEETGPRGMLGEGAECQFQAVRLGPKKKDD